MPERSYPWAGTLLGDAGRYTPNFYSVYQHSLIGLAEENPYRAPIAGTGDELLVGAGFGGMNVIVEIGAAFVAGKVYVNTDQVVFVCPLNTSGLVRYDRVVLRRRVPEQTVRLALLIGLPGAGIPACTNIYGTQTEVSLAIITVASGAVVINAADIADNRGFWRDRRLWLGVGDWQADSTKPAPLVIITASGHDLRAWQFVDNSTRRIAASVLIPAEWGDTPRSLYPWAWVLHEPSSAVWPHAFFINLYGRAQGDPSAPIALSDIGVPSATNYDNVLERRLVSGGLGAPLTARPGEVVDLLWESTGVGIGQYQYFLGMELVVRQ